MDLRLKKTFVILFLSKAFSHISQTFSRKESSEIIRKDHERVGISCKKSRVNPNPVYNDALLTVSSPEEIIQSVKLVDISGGGIVYNNGNVNSNTCSINVSALQNGFYALTVWLRNGQGGDFIVCKL